MLIPKIGCVAAHPANVHRLLVRRAAAGARLPRGPQGHREALQGPLQAAPLRPRRLRGGRDARAGADRAGVRGGRRGGRADLRPAQPAQAADRPALLRRSRRRSRTSARSGCWATCPAKFKLRFLEPIHFDERGHARGQGARPDGRPRGAGADPGEPASRWSASGARSGSADDAVEARPHHRAVDLLGRPAGAGARGTTSRSRRSSASTTRTRASSSSAPSSCGSAPSTRCCGAWWRRRRSTRWSTPAWWSTRPTSLARKAHENNVIGTMNILAACSGPTRRCESSSSSPRPTSTAAEQDDPAFFDESMGRPHPPQDADRARHRRGRGVACATSPRRTRCVDVTILRFANVLGPDVRTSHIDLFSLPGGADDPRLRPALPVRARGRRGARARARGAARAARRLQRGRRRRARADRGGRPAGQALRADPAAVGHGPRRRGPAAPRACKVPPEMLNQLRFGRGLDNRLLKADGFRLRLHHARDRRWCSASTCACTRCCAGGAGALPLRARGRGVPALEPARARLAGAAPRPRSAPTR